MLLGADHAAGAGLGQGDTFYLAFRRLRHYFDWRPRGFAMSTGPNRILDELAKLMTDAAGAAQGVRREVETAFKGQAEKVLNSMDVVQREEFEAAREMAVRARAENKALAARIDALEARIAELTSEKPLQTASAAAAKAKSKK
jgi:BMFP domain-containing protein YqiC